MDLSRDDEQNEQLLSKRCRLLRLLMQDMLKIKEIKQINHSEDTLIAKNYLLVLIKMIQRCAYVFEKQ